MQKTPPENVTKILTLLDKLGVNYTLHGHPAVYTAEEAAVHYSDMTGARCKNLFLRNRRGDTHYLVSISDDKRVNLKALAVIFEEKQLSFASDKRLMKYLQITPGSVSPAGLLFDKKAEVKYYVDRDVWAHNRMLFHPNDNTKTIELPRAGLEKFLQHTGHKIHLITIPQ